MAADPFRVWLEQVDEILLDHIGLPADGMGDFMSRDLFDSGATPHEGAIECLRANDADELADELEVAA